MCTDLVRTRGRGVWMVVVMVFLLTLLTSVAAQAQTKLVVWWNKGYYQEEDEALLAFGRRFEQANPGVSVEITFFTTEDLPKKLISAVEAKAPPDVVFSHYSDWMLIARYAREGKLVDVSDVVEANRNRYIESMVMTAYQWNDVEKKRAFYGIPTQVQTIHVHYWLDLLEEAGLDPHNIPTEWEGFWNYWTTAQDRLRATGKRDYRRLFGIGLPVSTGATDTFFTFEQILPNFGGQLVSPQGELLIDQPRNREALLRTVDFMTRLYLEGYSPPGSITWLDPDNNVNFHNRTTIMTPNPTLSIPGAQLFSNPDNYYNRIRTVEWPLSPEGKRVPYKMAVKTVLMFKDARNIDLGKKFMNELIRPENLGPYLKAANGRWFPVFHDVAADPFFHDPKDPHVPVATRMFLQNATEPFYYVYHPAYSQVYTENVWGRALGRVIVDRWTPERAVDEAIERVKTIFAQWGR